MAPISTSDYDVPATLVWLHPPYDKTAITEVCDDFTLAEAVRFVMESLAPERRSTARISMPGRDLSAADIAAIHRRPDFPKP